MWKPVVGYEGRYEVSDKGEVRSLDRISGRGHKIKGVALKPTKNKSGHWYVALHNKGQTSKTIHRLVAEVFIPNPNNLPLVRHLDDNPDNNHVNNLAWGTKRDNHDDAIRNGRIKYRDKCLRGHILVKDITHIGGCRPCGLERAQAFRDNREFSVENANKLCDDMLKGVWKSKGPRDYTREHRLYETEQLDSGEADLESQR